MGFMSKFFCTFYVFKIVVSLFLNHSSVSHNYVCIFCWKRLIWNFGGEQKIGRLSSGFVIPCRDHFGIER